MVTSAAMNIVVHVSLWVSFGYMFRSGIVGSCGNSVCTFWGICIVFSIVAATIYIPTKSVGGFFFPYSLQHLFIVFLLMAIMTSVSWYLIVILICICLAKFSILSCAFWLFVFWELSFGLLLIFWMVFSFEGFFCIEFCELIVLLLVVLNYFS